MGRRIALTSHREGNLETYTMKDDGSDIKRIIDTLGSDWRPSWFPNVSIVVSGSDRDGNLEIYVMNEDGSGLTRLSDNNRQDQVPVWSPDGRTIAFRSDALWDENREISSIEC